MKKLKDFAVRALSVSEDGLPAVVRLCREGEADAEYTWQSPYPEPDEWVAQVEGFLAELREDLPARKTALTIQAVNRDGVVPHQVRLAVVGLSKSAGAVDNGPRAMSAAWDSMSRTMSSMLESAGDQVRQMAAIQQQQAEQISGLMSLMRAQQERELVLAARAAENSGGDDELAATVKAYLPQLVGMLTTKNGMTKA